MPGYDTLRYQDSKDAGYKESEKQIWRHFRRSPPKIYDYCFDKIRHD
jgi:hypothetical protein